MSLHYKKDGSLDMRYSSSKAAMSSGGGGNSWGGSYSSSTSTYGGNNLHYKKDGSLDMRYSSSKLASTGVSASSSGHAPQQSNLHYKKDGSLDMRYSSSKSAVSAYGNVVNKKDGTPDMRYKSSQIARMTGNFGQLAISSIPSHIPKTKAGLPDMRTRAGKEWVQSEAQRSSGVPSWIPTKKDGSPDTSKVAVLEFLRQQDVPYIQNQNAKDYLLKEQYYNEKMCDPESCFKILAMAAREQEMKMPEPYVLPESKAIHKEMSFSTSGIQAESSVFDRIPGSIPLINYEEINGYFEERNQIGRGNFGTVFKGKWMGKDVAIKRLHLTQLMRKERDSFVKELRIMAYLGKHPNLVELHGYTLEPPCFIMEYIRLGNLSYIMHYCEDDTIQANFTTGTTKKRILLGIVNGMSQLHSANVIHGDLKPGNVLINEQYTAKITDFGLATLRGKSTSSLASKDDGEMAVVGGTGGYMAPELLDSSGSPEPSSDVYSFGVLLNEVIHEEEPYAGQYRNFLGRGPFGAALYAKQGNRPFINVEKTGPLLKKLIEDCWNPIPRSRPVFDKISTELRKLDIPNSF